MRITNTTVDYPDEAPHPSESEHKTRLTDPKTGDPMREVTYLQQLLRARYATAGLAENITRSDESINELVKKHVSAQITEQADPDAVETNLSVDGYDKPSFKPGNENEDPHTLVEEPDRNAIDNPQSAPPVATKKIEQLKHKWKQQLLVLNTKMVQRNNEIITRVGITHDYVESHFDNFSIDVGQIYRTSIRGKKFAFTGKLPGCTRPEVKERVEALGGDATGGVSSKTDMLVVGDNPGTVKKQNAENHGTETMSGRDFLNKLNNLEETREESADTDSMPVRVHSLTDEDFKGDPTMFGYELPLLSLVVSDDTDFNRSESLHDGATYDTWLQDRNTYPLLPWYGTVACPCHRFYERDKGICKHEMYALIALKRDGIDIDEYNLLPQRFKRFVHPRANRVFRNDIL